MATSVRGRKVNAFQALALLLAFVLMATVGGLLTAGLVLPAVAVTNGATDLTVTVFDDLPSELGEQRPLSEKSTMLAADGSVLATFYHENRNVVALDQIAPIMRSAVLAVEDKRFFEHGGIDPTGMARATVKTLLSDQKEGASTLTQQYVKNVLIEKATRDKDRDALEAARVAEGTEGISRKLREAKLAIALEKSMPKEQILENYLNIAQFGIAIYGVETAAQYYFSKPAAELTYLEAATIAGITQAPTKWDPVKNPEQATVRRATVLQLMRDQGLITPEEHDTGVATPIEQTLHIQPTKLTCAAASDVVPGAGYFCDYVTKVIINDPAFGPTEVERRELLYRGGLTIRTTLDPREQTIADEEVKAGIPVDDSSGVASAIAVVEPGTGQIKAMAQNRIYSAANDGGDRTTAVNYNTDTAYGGSAGFQPGSTFKPFTLVQWLKEGHTLNEVVNAQPLSYPMTDFNSSCANFRGAPKKNYEFGNAENNSRFPMSVLDATKNSVNSGYIAMARDIDLCGMIQSAEELGVHTGSGGKLTVTPANVLGTDSIAPLTMAAAFATFASGGTYCAPIAITSVQDANGAELPVPSAGCRNALEPRIANAVNHALSNVWTGTAEKVGAPPFPSAGKTGTTNKNENTWFVGYTPLRAAAVWVGYSEGSIPVQNMTVNGSFVKYMYGSTVAAPTWKRFMVRALEGVDVPGFAGVSNDELYGKQSNVPYVVGQPVAEAESKLRAAGFQVQVAPERVPSGSPAEHVAQQNPSGTATRGSTIRLTLSNGQQQQGGGQPGGGQQGGGQPGGGPGGGGGNNGQVPMPNPRQP